jgi:SAM-dependent methyltransferase
VYPSIFDSSYLTLRNRRVQIERFLARHQKMGRVLDVGAQYCPYFPLFKDKCDFYTSLDIVETPIVDMVCDAVNIPVNDDSFDVLLCTAVLGHTNDPQAIIDECHRVLKPGGTLILTVPSIFPQNGYPADNWRFMPDGLKYLMRSFSRVEVIGEMDFPESFFSVVGHYGHVVTGRLGALGRALNVPWDFAMNLSGMFWSAVLRPFSNSNFTAFTISLWAEGTK